MNGVLKELYPNSSMSSSTPFHRRKGKGVEDGRRCSPIGPAHDVARRVGKHTHIGIGRQRSGADRRSKYVCQSWQTYSELADVFATVARREKHAYPPRRRSSAVWAQDRPVTSRSLE